MTIYTLWGATTCPNFVKTVYTGFAAAPSTARSLHDQDDDNPAARSGELVCMHSDLWTLASSAESDVNLATAKRVSGVPYADASSKGAHGWDRTRKAAACAVCQRGLALQTYVRWGYQDCRTHQTEVS